MGLLMQALLGQFPRFQQERIRALDLGPALDVSEQLFDGLAVPSIFELLELAASEPRTSQRPRTRASKHGRSRAKAEPRRPSISRSMIAP